MMLEETALLLPQAITNFFYLEQEAISRADCKGGNLGEGFRSGLKNDQQHANWRCDLVQD